MEISSHYYALLALSRICGISKDTSHKIAYASQFVDDAKINCITSTDGFDMENIATCHSYSKIRTFNYQAMIHNTVSFHFPPGCEGDDFTQKLVCKENSPIIRQIIEEEITGYPEIFGMLMHIYADTFAHQGFSGLLSSQNDIEKLEAKNLLKFQNGVWSYFSYLWKNLKILNRFKEEKDFDDFMPAYGHGQAEHYPDIPYLEWSYEYSHDRCNRSNGETVEVNNVERFRRAFENIQECLVSYLEKHPKYKDPNFNENKKKSSLVEFFEILKARESTKNKIKSWQRFLVNNEYYNHKEDNHIISYNETLWIKELIKDYDEESELHKKRTLTNIAFNDGYEESSWIKFITGSATYKINLQTLCAEHGLILNK